MSNNVATIVNRKPKLSSAVSETTHLSYPKKPVVRESTLKENSSPGQNAYLDYRGNKPRFSPKRKPRKPRSERMKIRYQTREKMVDLFRQLGEFETAERMAVCSERYSVLTCGEHILSKQAVHRCEIRFCPECAHRRSQKYVNKYLPYALEFSRQNPNLQVCLLTLTQVKLRGENVLDARKRMMSSFDKLRERDFFNEYFAGGIYTAEIVTSDEGQHHYHLHVVVFRRKFVDHKLLKKHWSAVSQGAKNLNIKLVDDLERGLRECIKYVSKPIKPEHLTKQHLASLWMLRGKRMIDCFGEFRRFVREFEFPEEKSEEKPEVGSCCPHCQNDSVLFELVMSAKQLIQFQQQIEFASIIRGKPKIVH